MRDTAAAMRDSRCHTTDDTAVDVYKGETIAPWAEEGQTSIPPPVVTPLFPLPPFHHFTTSILTLPILARSDPFLP